MEKTVLEIRSQDNKTPLDCAIGFGSGKITELDHQHDDAWIGGPGIPKVIVSVALGFIDNYFYFQSETTGFRICTRTI